MDTQSLMMNEYVNKGRENCVGSTSPWMGHEFLQGENALMVPMKVSLCPLHMREACPQDHNHISRNGAQGDIRGTGTTLVHREHSSGE